MADDYFRSPGRPGAANLSMRHVVKLARERINEEWRPNPERQDAALLLHLRPCWPSATAQNN